MVGRNVLLGLSLTAALATQAKASCLSFDAIKNWTGSGMNEAAMVIDWNDGIAPQAMEWGFRWNSDNYPSGITSQDMLQAIAASDSHLFNNQAMGSGIIFGVGYTFTDQAFAYVPGANGDLNQDGHAGVAGDHYEEGWYNGYWSVWGMSASDPSWNYSEIGIGASLTDQSWVGLSWVTGDESNDEFAEYLQTGIWPNPPLTAAMLNPTPAPVPEPATLSVLGVGAAALLLRRRK